MTPKPRSAAPRSVAETLLAVQLEQAGIPAIEAEAGSTPAEALDPLRSALERLLAVSMTEEEDVSAATQDEWIAAIQQANEALDQ